MAPVSCSPPLERAISGGLDRLTSVFARFIARGLLDAACLLTLVAVV
jgi:hypothetical protein